MTPPEPDDDLDPSPSDFWILVLVLMIANFGLGAATIDFFRSYLP